MRIVWRAVINAVAIVVASSLLPGISWGGAHYGFGDADPYASLVLTGLALGIVNAVIRPILVIVSFPITCLTVGLFLLVINALMLLLVSAIPGLGFHVDGFMTAFIGSIIISIVSFVLSRVLPD